MDPSRGGLSSAAKTAGLLALVLVVLGAAYLSSSFSSSGGTTTTTTAQSGGSSSTRASAAQNSALLPLFGNFSEMELQVNVMNSDPEASPPEMLHVSYLVLGKAFLNTTTSSGSRTLVNSAQYEKVAFTTVGGGNNVIAWFNAQGGVDRVDVLGQRNYTGSGAYIVASIYVVGFSLVPAITNNSSLLAMLNKTAQNSTSIGPTQMDVATYSLAVPTAPYKSVTLKVATIAGTNEKVAVYLHQKTVDGTDTTVQVLSLKR